MSACAVVVDTVTGRSVCQFCDCTYAHARSLISHHNKKHYRQHGRIAKLPKVNATLVEKDDDREAPPADDDCGTPEPQLEAPAEPMTADDDCGTPAENVEPPAETTTRDADYGTPTENVEPPAEPMTADDDCGTRTENVEPPAETTTTDADCGTPTENVEPLAETTTTKEDCGTPTENVEPPAETTTTDADCGTPTENVKTPAETTTANEDCGTPTENVEPPAETTIADDDREALTTGTTIADYDREAPATDLPLEEALVKNIDDVKADMEEDALPENIDTPDVSQDDQLDITTVPQTPPAPSETDADSTEPEQQGSPHNDEDMLFSGVTSPEVQHAIKKIKKIKKFKKKLKRAREISPEDDETLAQ